MAIPRKIKSGIIKFPPHHSRQISIPISSHSWLRHSCLEIGIGICLSWFGGNFIIPDLFFLGIPPIPHFLRKVWNWSIPHFWEIFSCFPYVLTSKPSILQRRVRGGSGGFISTLWFWILLLKKCEIEIIWKWYIGKSNTISYVVNSHQLYWNGKSGFDRDFEYLVRFFFLVLINQA